VSLVLNSKFEKKPSILEIAISFDAPPHPFAGLRLFHSAFLAGLEIDRVFLDLLDDRFLLHFPLETAKSGFKVFTFIEDYKSQRTFTSILSGKSLKGIIFILEAGDVVKERPLRRAF
jgi:hypothetical protein